MALPPVTKVIIAFDICHGLARQPQCLGRVDGRSWRCLAVRQPVQNVDDMGLGGNARLKRQLHGTQHSLLVMLEHEGQDLDHLPVAPWAFEQLALQLPEGIGQFGKRRAIAQGPGLALDDGEIMPPIIDCPPGQVPGR